MAVAFATSSGTSRIYGALKTLNDRGATATAHVGLSNGITSAQAVEQLIQAGVQVFGFETGGSVLFHPKAYVLRSPGQTWISVGSSNLTADGLYRNFEANSISVSVGAPDDVAAIAEFSQVLLNLRGMQGHSSRLQLTDLQRLVTAGSLIDETVTPVPQRIKPRPGGARQRGGNERIQVPAAPPPHPDLGTVRRPRAAVPAPAAAPAIAPAIQSRFFAMTLSDFDVSHRRGVRGTPEVSLPEECVAFFPAVQMQGRQYPDAYFDVLLNERTGGARTVRYRIWQRPPGTDAGHADWRINVGHDTIDQTNAGGDILLVERLPDGSDPAYEVWIVRVEDPEHAPLLTRCNRTVQARGRAGVKQFGLF
ncbi:MAG: phospholipase D-like domain-containing protein [Vicinamibacterales bacterium]